MPRASTFTFVGYEVDAPRSAIVFTFRVHFEHGDEETYVDRFYFKDVSPDRWQEVPEEVLRPTLQALLIMAGINYWAVFATKDIRIEGFTLTREQAYFWDTLYLNGLGEFFYDMKMDFGGLIAFPFDETYSAPAAARFPRPARSLLLNGAGKDSILSAEMLKTAGSAFDFFAFTPTPAHARIARLVGAGTIRVTRRMDPRLGRFMRSHRISPAYPSVSTFTFTAVLLAELLGYDSVIFSNERSADFGNFTYKGLAVNHQWCKSTEAETMINDYIRRYITPDITTYSLLRKFSELEIVRRFVQYPQYLSSVTSCNGYFWLPPLVQFFSRKAYWCKRCPKCVFLFACYAAYLPKKEVVRMFGGDLFSDANLLPLFKSILGLEGTKPLDCVGEPEEMVLAMHMAGRDHEYDGEPAMQMFEEHFPADFDFKTLEPKGFS